MPVFLDFFMVWLLKILTLRTFWVFYIKLNKEISMPSA